MRQKRIKTVIILLAILLAVSIAALIGVLIYKAKAPAASTTVTVSDNIVTSDALESSDKPETPQSSPDSSGSTRPSSSESGGNNSSKPKTAEALSLHKRKPDDNTPFKVGNMFPGDSETKYYCVRVSHKGNVVLRFRADIQPGYEKLAEVLCCRVTSPENGEVIYDGLMRDMPKSLNHSLTTSARRTSEVYYEITAYLDTSVGNEYMNRDLKADFIWWVEETENLDFPKTGDSFNLYLWLCVAVGSLFLLILLCKKLKKEDRDNEG